MAEVAGGGLDLVDQVALVLADALGDHAGGNSVGEARRNLSAYLDRVGERA